MLNDILDYFTAIILTLYVQFHENMYPACLFEGLPCIINNIKQVTTFVIRLIFLLTTSHQLVGERLG